MPPSFGGGTSDHALAAHFRIQKTFCSAVRAVAPVASMQQRAATALAKLAGIQRWLWDSSRGCGSFWQALETCTELDRLRADLPVHARRSACCARPATARRHWWLITSQAGAGFPSEHWIDSVLHWVICSRVFEAGPDQEVPETAVRKSCQKALPPYMQPHACT